MICIRACIGYDAAGKRVQILPEDKVINFKQVRSNRGHIEVNILDKGKLIVKRDTFANCFGTRYKEVLSKMKVRSNKTKAIGSVKVYEKKEVKKKKAYT